MKWRQQGLQFWQWHACAWYATPFQYCLHISLKRQAENVDIFKHIPSAHHLLWKWGWLNKTLDTPSTTTAPKWGPGCPRNAVDPDVSVALKQPWKPQPTFGWSSEPSVSVAITDVFLEKKNGINVSNKFMRILKIFTKIYDIKNHRVIYAVFALRGRS